MDPSTAVSKPPILVVAALSTIAGAGVLATAFYITKDPRIVIILLLGMVIVVALLLVYALVLRILKRRKEMPFLRSLMGNTAAAPNSVSSPEARARIDALARTFQGGIQKFRSAGKDLYGLPWYLLVGEPGSGKTEAIRHCNVGFPPGLQDWLQGSGGTLNMNWWFTNQAVILDTAGRLLFDEVEPGTTNEWDEFLQMLVQHRPNCPINGLLLVIPAESVIKDTSEQISTKAGKIAQQLDHVQRTLGVRFPVFVVVTKCDKINGFRYFFENLRDLGSQHQMLGWSNPAPLDKPFNAELVDSHLKEISQRLLRRRLGLLLDPVTDDPSERRIDQMDTLYVFPDSFLQIAPRLRQYLETIFTPGEWSPKPLFLRGIFFASSLREGSAMDVELAQMLGVSVDALPEGKVWERDRSYFLRDLFLSKVFRERSLVTRADNTRNLQRRRKLTLMTMAFASVITLLFVTWFGNYQLKHSIGDESDFWTGVNGLQQAQQLGVVQRSGDDFQYAGDTPVPLGPGGATIPLIDFYGDMRSRLDQKIDVYWIFRPMAAVGRLNGNRQEALASLYRGNVLGPVVQGAEFKLDGETPQHWSNSATLALAELIHAEAAAGGAVPPRISPLLSYVVGASAQPSSRDLAILDDAGDAVAARSAGAGAIGGFLTDPARLAALNAGIQNLTDHWNFELSKRNPRLDHVSAMADDLSAFDKARKSLQQMGMGLKLDSPTDAVSYSDRFGDWKNRLASLKTAADNLKRDSDNLQSDGWQQDESIAQFYSDEVRTQLADAGHAYQFLLSQIPDGVQGSLASCRSSLVTGQDGLNQLKQETDEDYKRIEGLDKTRVEYPVVSDMCAQVDQNLPNLSDESAAADGDWTSLASNVQRMLTTIHNLSAHNDRIALQDDSLKPDADNCDLILQRMAQPARLRLMIKSALAPLQNNNQEVTVADLVQRFQHDHAEDPHYQSWKFPSIPMTNIDAPPSENPSFNPTAAREVVRSWEIVQTLLAPPDSLNPTTLPTEVRTVFNSDQTPDVLGYQDLGVSDDYSNKQAAVRDYGKNYLSAWTLTPDQFTLGTQTWNTVINNLPDAAGTNADLHAAAEKYSLALQEEWLGKLNDDEEFQTALAAASKSASDAMAATQPGNPQGICDISSQAIQAWSELRAVGAVEARRRILDMTAENFRAMLVPLNDDADPATRYWQNVVATLLDSLASESEKIRTRAISTLYESYQVFPLAPYKAGQGILNPGDVNKVSDLLDQIGVDSASGAPGAATTLIRDGGHISGDSAMTKRVNNSLDRLRGISLNQKQEDWLRTMRETLKSLTDPRVTISLLPEPDQAKLRGQYSGDRGIAANSWALVQLSQGRRPIGDKQNTMVRGADPVSLGQVDYSGDPVQFYFFRDFAGGAPDEPNSDAAAISSWDCLRLLSLPNALTPNGGKKWDVELVFDFSGQEYCYWIQLDFGDIPFNPSKDWPP